MRNLNENKNWRVDRILTQKKLNVEEPPRKTSRPSREISQSCIGSRTR